MKNKIFLLIILLYSSGCFSLIYIDTTFVKISTTIACAMILGFLLITNRLHIRTSILEKYIYIFLTLPFISALSATLLHNQDITISRVTVATETEAETKNTMFGHKFIIPYALYKVEGYVSANLARKVTGFSEEDLQLLWKAIINMFECDRAAARGNMAVRELIVFKHESELGEAPAYKLFDTVKISRNNPEKPARAYSDYTVTIDESKIPAGVTMQRMI